MSERRATQVEAIVEYALAQTRRVTQVRADVEYQVQPLRRVSQVFAQVEYVPPATTGNRQMPALQVT